MKSLGRRKNNVDLLPDESRAVWLNKKAFIIYAGGCLSSTSSTRMLYFVEKHNTIFGSKAICTQAVYFLYSTMLSVACLRLNDVSVICSVTYFQFPIQSAYLPCLSAMQHSGVLVYPISDIGRCRKFGSVSCTERIAQGNDKLYSPQMVVTIYNKIHN